MARVYGMDRIAVVAAVNDEAVFEANLAVSDRIRAREIPIRLYRGYDSASTAYCDAIAQLSQPVLVFAHQDVFLPDGWFSRLERYLAVIAETDPKWGVLGVVGMDASSRVRGRSWSNGLQRQVGLPECSTVPIVSLDELLIVLNTESGVRFDRHLPGFHLYGTDVVQTALLHGQGAYVIDNPVVHNSLPVGSLKRDYAKSYLYVRRKWLDMLPIPTTVVDVTSSRWPLTRRLISGAVKSIRFSSSLSGKSAERLVNPDQLAAELGYSGRPL